MTTVTSFLVSVEGRLGDGIKEILDLRTGERVQIILLVNVSLSARRYRVHQI